MPLDQPPAITHPVKEWEFKNLTPEAYIIESQGEPLVTINAKDGSLVYGPHYTPDKAAHQFRLALSAEYRDFLKWKSEHQPKSE